MAQQLLRDANGRFISRSKSSSKRVSSPKSGSGTLGSRAPRSNQSSSSTSRTNSRSSRKGSVQKLTQTVYRDPKTGRFLSMGMAKEMRRHRAKVSESTISLIIPQRDRETGRFLPI